MKYKILALLLAALTLSACKVKVGAEVYAEITPLGSNTPAVQPVQASAQVTTVTTSKASTAVSQKQSSTIKSPDDCSDPCEGFGPEMTVELR